MDNCSGKPGEGVAPSEPCIPIPDPHYAPGSSSSYQSTNGKVKIGKIMVFVNLGYAKLDSAVASAAASSTSLSTNAWSVDQSSGCVVLFMGDINMQGNAILDVKKITGYLGKWSIDEDGTLMAVRVITDEMVTKKLTVGSAAAPSGITLYDEVTRDPYCLKMRNGAMVSDAGVCGASAGAPAPAPSAPSPVASDTATTSPAAEPPESAPLPDVATSTPPTIATTTPITP